MEPYAAHFELGGNDLTRALYHYLFHSTTQEHSHAKLAQCGFGMPIEWAGLKLDLFSHTPRTMDTHQFHFPKISDAMLTSSQNFRAFQPL